MDMEKLICDDLDWESGRFITDILRLKPRNRNGVSYSGHLDSIPLPVSPMQVANAFGGGDYKVLVLFQKTPQSSYTVLDEQFFSIPGEPKIISTAIPFLDEAPEGFVPAKHDDPEDDDKEENLALVAWQAVEQTMTADIGTPSPSENDEKESLPKPEKKLSRADLVRALMDATKDIDVDE